MNEKDPQQVYDNAFINYECNFAYDDEEAIIEVIERLGVEAAKTVQRRNACHSIDYILTPNWIKHTWAMLNRLKMDCDYYLGYGNRLADNLWAHDEKEHLAEMRRLLATLPDEYKPAHLTNEIIDEYEKKMLG